MDKKKTVLISVPIIVLGFAAYKMLSNSHVPIFVGGEKYTHVDVSEVNGVENHFFTPQGVDVPKADKFIQISKYDHSDLTADHVSIVQSQIIKSFGLQPIEGYDDRFFGMFRGTLPVYGLMSTGAFVLHFGPQSAEDPAELRAGADGFIDQLAAIPIDF